MIRAQRLLVLSSLFLLVGCSQGDENSTAIVVKEHVHAESWRESQILEGQETYEAVCASCHDQGEGDAPAIGDKGAWSDRSGLWVAVLAGHANEGYLDMPEKGGHGELTEQSVTAAAEYMLHMTFPDLPRD